MKNYTNTITKRIIAKAEATGFDKLSYFNMPDENHKNYWVSDEKTGLTHILLQDLTINTVDTDVYEDYRFGDVTWTNDLCASSKRKGKYGYVTTLVTDPETEKQYAFRQARIITNTLDAGRHLVVDHLNGNTYDNRRINLSTCTQQANLKNQYPYKEVPAIVYPWDHE